nr:hypothetical protein [Desulfobulbaceae bacterium]
MKKFLSGTLLLAFTVMFNRTGINGKRAGIGRSNTIGVSGILNHEIENMSGTGIIEKRV